MLEEVARERTRGDVMTLHAAPPATTVTVAPAARAVDAVKIYGKGATEVRALDHVDVEFATGAFHGHHEPVRFGEVDPAAWRAIASE
jgi:hypothetical protein